MARQAGGRRDLETRRATPRSVPPTDRVVAGVRFRLRQRTLDTPGLSELFTRFDRTLDYARITDSTRLVIDGYPRSGNTYARAALLYANGPELGVSTHGHSARFVELGIKKGLPVVVLLRDPVAAITSRLHIETMTDPRSLVRAYRRYYSHVTDVRDNVLIAPFDAVVGDFGTVTRACNDVFATNLAVYEKTPLSEARVRAAIDREAEELVGPAWLEAVSPRPSATRVDPSSWQSGLDTEGRRHLDESRSLHDQLLAGPWVVGTF